MAHPCAGTTTSIASIAVLAASRARVSGKLCSPLLALIITCGCTGLRPLPPPRLGPCEAISNSSSSDLWRCLDEIDSLVQSDISRPQPRESAYRSTTRVTAGDLRRKFGDQSPKRACGGRVPAGFVNVPEREKMEPRATGRAPLHAYFRAARPGMATVIVLHGLYDSKHSRYIRLTAELLAAQGFGVLVPDLRWHGCLFHWPPTLGLEEAQDVVAWREWLRERTPESPVGLVGFSLGSLDVIRALALDSRGDIFRAGGIVISPPARLRLTFVAVDDPPSFADHGGLSLVQRFFHLALRRRMRTIAGVSGVNRAAAGLDPASERPFTEILDWLAGQPPWPPGTNWSSLLERADPGPQLALIRRPLAIVASRRDPVCSELAFVDLFAAAEANPSLHLFATTDGGHIGQIGTYPQWMSDLLVRFFRASPEVGP